MIDISKWAFENKKLIYFLIAVLIAGGAYSSYEMSKLEDPEITVKLAMVVTTYPGASAHQVELEVTDVLEKNIRSMGNIDNVESYSYNDMITAAPGGFIEIVAEYHNIFSVEFCNARIVYTFCGVRYIIFGKNGHAVIVTVYCGT